MTGLSRFAAVVLLLAALTGAGGKGCTGEAGTAPATPAAAPDEPTHRIWLLATGQLGAERAHIAAGVVGRTPFINGDRNLPWQQRYDIPDDQFFEFDVTLVDKLSGKGTVRCYIHSVNGDGRILDEGGPGPEAKCFLPPLKQPA